MGIRLVPSRIGIALALAALPGLAHHIPDAKLEVAVHRVESGVTQKPVHILRLTCTGDQCRLTSITLNDCMYPNPRSFVPWLEITSTAEGTLAVTREKNTLIAVETGSDIGGNFVTTHRFTYSPAASQHPISEVTAYSGATVKNSALLEQMLAFEFKPLVGMTTIPLQCPVRVFGVTPPE